MGDGLATGHHPFGPRLARTAIFPINSVGIGAWTGSNLAVAHRDSARLQHVQRVSRRTLRLANLGWSACRTAICSRFACWPRHCRCPSHFVSRWFGPAMTGSDRHEPICQDRGPQVMQEAYADKYIIKRVTQLVAVKAFSPGNYHEQISGNISNKEWSI